jgi:hypothetical protein
MYALPSSPNVCLKKNLLKLLQQKRRRLKSGREETADDGLLICGLFNDAVNSSDYKASRYFNDLISHVRNRTVFLEELGNIYNREGRGSNRPVAIRRDTACAVGTVCRPLYLTAALATVTE